MCIRNNYKKTLIEQEKTDMAVRREKYLINLISFQQPPMNVQDLNGRKLVTISKPFGNRAKILHLFYFILFFAAATIFLKLLITEAENAGAIIVASLGTIAFYIAAYRFANKAVSAEKILVGENSIQIINQGLFKKSIKEYEVSRISNFRHLAQQQLSKHPLAGDNLDYLGFQTEQQVINNMHGENRLAFDYDGRTITFGDNIYSWEFDELSVIIFS